MSTKNGKAKKPAAKRGNAIAKPRKVKPIYPPDPDETVDIRKLIAEVVPNHEVWLETPNTMYMGMKPADVIGTRMEPFMRNMIRAAKHGMFS